MVEGTIEKSRNMVSFPEDRLTISSSLSISRIRRALSGLSLSTLGFSCDCGNTPTCSMARAVLVEEAAHRVLFRLCSALRTTLAAVSYHFAYLLGSFLLTDGQQAGVPIPPVFYEGGLGSTAFAHHRLFILRVVALLEIKCEDLSFAAWTNRRGWTLVGRVVHQTKNMELYHFYYRRSY